MVIQYMFIEFSNWLSNSFLPLASTPREIVFLYRIGKKDKEHFGNHTAIPADKAS